MIYLEETNFIRAEYLYIKTTRPSPALTAARCPSVEKDDVWVQVTNVLDLRLGCSASLMV